MNAEVGVLPLNTWDVFVPYSGFHVLVVAVCALLIAAPTLLSRSLAKEGELRVRRSLAALAVCYWIGYSAWWNWHGVDTRTGLPLQICDINGLIAPFALLTGWRWMRATLYFWTAALTLQAFIQPALRLGPTSPIFWAFWIAHTIIFASAVYDIVVLGFRPTWRDLGRAVIASAVYVAVVMPIDGALGANYGFLGNPADPSEVPPFVAALGPWPQRAIIVVAMAPLGFAVVLLPWLIARPRAHLQTAGTKPYGSS